MDFVPTLKNTAGNVYGKVYFHRGPCDLKMDSAVSNANVRVCLNLGSLLEVTVENECSRASAGKALAFDHSFEHQIKFDKMVLVIDVWNPCLTPNDIQIQQLVYDLNK